MVFSQGWSQPQVVKDYRGAPVVSHGPARVSPYELGVTAGRNPREAAALASHPAPGESLHQVVPALTKARHPATGRFVSESGGELARGHASLDASPKPLSGGGGPFAAQFSDPSSRSSGSSVGFQELPAMVPEVSRLDLRGPSGTLPGIVAVDPSPVSHATPCPDPQSDPDHPVARGAGPLESALTAHSGRTTLFGFDTGQAVSEVP